MRLPLWPPPTSIRSNVRFTRTRALALNAHVIAAERNGLPNEKLATILAGQRPADLTSDEGVAYDVASALPRHGTFAS